MSKQTENLKLHLYDTGDKFNITADNNSLNNNMELIDAAISSKADIEIVGGIYSATISEFYVGSQDSLVIGNKYLMTYEPTYPFIFYNNQTDVQNGTMLCVAKPDDSSIIPGHIILYNSITNHGTSINSSRVVEVEIQNKSYNFIQFYIVNEPIVTKTLSDKQDKFAEVTDGGSEVYIDKSEFSLNLQDQMKINFSPEVRHISLGGAGTATLAGLAAPEFATDATNKAYVDEKIAQSSLATLAFDWTTTNFSQQSGPWTPGLYSIIGYSHNMYSYMDNSNTPQSFYLTTPQNHPLAVGDAIYITTDGGTGETISRVITVRDKQDKLSQFAEDQTNNIAQITAEQLDLKRVVINYNEIPYTASYNGGSGHTLDTLYTVSDFYDSGNNEYSVTTNGNGGFNFTCANQLNIPIGTNIKIQLSDEYTDPTTIEAATSAIRNGSGPVKIKLIVVEESESIANMPINGVSTITSDNLSLRGGSNDYGSSLDLSDRTAVLSSYSDIRLVTNSGKITMGGSEIELFGDTIKLTPNSTAPTNPVKLLNVATPTNGTDAANKAYVDSLIGSGGSGGMDPRYGTISQDSQGNVTLLVGEYEFNEDYDLVKDTKYYLRHANDNEGGCITFDSGGLELWGVNKLNIYAENTIEIINTQNSNYNAVKIGSADDPYYIGALGIGKNNGPTRMTIEDQNIRLTTGVSGSIGIKNSVDTANMADAEIALDTTTNTTYIQTKELVLFRPHHTMSEGNTEMLVRSGSGPIRITGLAAPKSGNDAATKSYVDSLIGSGGGSGAMDARYGTISEDSYGNYVLAVGAYYFDEDANSIDKSYIINHASGSSSITLDSGGLEFFGVNKLKVWAESTIEILNLQDHSFDSVQIGSSSTPYYFGNYGLSRNTPTRLQIEDNDTGIKMAMYSEGEIGIHKNFLSAGYAPNTYIVLDPAKDTSYIHSNVLQITPSSVEPGRTYATINSPDYGLKITNLITPTDDTDAVNKAYVDAAIAAALNK